ncbi:tape measure protein [Pseudomonas alloputida]|uniref:tape measure protein n=1 Tax=Pseudomonas alloputida TaxID=1940621 RepID=UPI0038630E77
MSEDIAVLGFEVDTGDIKRARDELGRFEGQGRQVETTAIRMERMVTSAFKSIAGVATTLARQIGSLARAWSLYEVATAAATGSVLKLTAALAGNAGELRKHEEQAKATSKALQLLKAGMAAIGISLGVSQLMNYADTYGSLRGQIMLTAESTQAMNSAWRDLYQISQQTAQSLKGTVELYARMARASQELNLNQTQLVSITDTINKTLMISRTPAASAEAALFQLSQAMASGALRGDELNSVMEQAPRLAQAIANGLGVSIGQLRAMGAEGQITAKKMIGALQSQKDYIDQEFAGVFVSVSNSMARVDSTMIQLVGRADEAAGASAVFGKAIADLITRLESNEALNSTTTAVNLLAVALDVGAKALMFMIDHLDVFIGLWAAGKVAGAILSATSALTAFSVGTRAAAVGASALGLSLGTASKAAAGFGAAIALTNPLGALLGLLSAVAAVYLLYAANATTAQEAETAFNKTLVDTGRNAQEYLKHLKTLNEAKRESLRLDLAKNLEAENEAMKGAVANMREQLEQLTRLQHASGKTGAPTSLADQQATLARQKQVADLLEQGSTGKIDSQQMLESLTAIAEKAGMTGKAMDDFKMRVGAAAVQMDDSAKRAANYQARIDLIKNPADMAAQAILGLNKNVTDGASGMDANGEEWSKFIGKLVAARDTIGMLKSEEVAYQAAQKGFSPERQAYVVVLAKQAEALNKYEKALKDANTAEAAKAKDSAMRTAVLEANAMQAIAIAEKAAMLAPLVAEGVMTVTEAANRTGAAGAKAYQDTLKAAQDRMTGILATIKANTTPSKDTQKDANREADALKDFIKDQKNAIDNANRLAEAYGKNAEAVRVAGIQAEVEKEMLKVNASARQQVVDLINKEHDARDRADLAKTTAELQKDTAEQQAHATAILGGEAALRAYNNEKAISAALSGKNAAAVKAEAEELRKAQAANDSARLRVDQATELQRMVESTANAQEKYNKQVADLEKLAKVAKTPEQVEAIRRSLIAAKKELIEAQNQLDPMAQKFASIASEIEDGFKESFISAFTEGENAFQKMTDGIKSMFKRLVAELAYQAAIKPILLPILQGTGQMMGLNSGNVTQILNNVLGNGNGATAGVGGGSVTSSGGLLQSLGKLFGGSGTGGSSIGSSGLSFLQSLGNVVSTGASNATSWFSNLFSGGGFSAASSGGGGGNLMSTMSSLNQAYTLGKGFMANVGSGVSGLWNGVQGAFGGNSVGLGLSQFGGWASGTSGLQGATMAGGNISGGMFANAGTISNLGYMGYGIAGNYIGDWVGGGKYSGALGSAGAVVGAAAGVSSAALGAQVGAFAGPVGALAGAVIGGLIGSLFGSNKKLKEQGIEANFSGTEMTDGRQYQVWVKKKMFGKKKKSIKYLDLPDGFQSEVNEKLGGLADYIDSVGDTAGIDLLSRTAAVNGQYHGGTDGFSEWMDGYVEKLLTAAAPNIDNFKKKDETTQDAFGRLEQIFKNYASIKDMDATDISKQVESLNAALAEASLAFETVAADATKMAEIEQTRAANLRKLADGLEDAAKQSIGMSLTDQQAMALRDYDKQAALTRKDAALVGANLGLIEAGIEAGRKAVIEQYQEQIRKLDVNLDQRQAVLGYMDREASVIALKEQQRAEMASAKAAGYSAAQLERLASVLAGEFADAMKQADMAIRGGNASIAKRLADLGDDTEAKRKAMLAVFDAQAEQELEQAKHNGLDIVMLEQVLAAERLQAIKDFNEQAIAAAKELGESYKAWLDGQKLGDTSTLTPAERLAEAQRQFDAQLEKARGGDKDAQGSITGYADQLLKIGRDFYASSEQYTTMADFIRKTIENLGKQLELPGFATGTYNAPRGMAWVGEQGPELVAFRGGEQVYTAGQSAAMAAGAGGTGGGQGGAGEVVKAIVTTGQDQTQQLGELVDLFGELQDEVKGMRRELRRMNEKP